MSVRSVLVVGGGAAGSLTAIVLARRGTRVTLLERTTQWPGTGEELVDARTSEVIVALGLMEAGSSTPQLDDVRSALAASAAALDVEVRTDIDLLGVFDVDSHVEAELSDGRVENYDAVVVADSATASILARRADFGTSHVTTVTDPADVVLMTERVAG